MADTEIVAELADIQNNDKTKSYSADDKVVITFKEEKNNADLNTPLTTKDETQHAYFDTFSTIRSTEMEATHLKSTYEQIAKYSGVKRYGEQISGYNSDLLNSPWKIFMCFHGSFCYYLWYQRAILTELLFYTLLFFLASFVTALNSYNFIPLVIVQTNTMNTLVSFFLGLFVALHVGRWWRLRMDGIGLIWHGSSGLATILGPYYLSFEMDHAHEKDNHKLIDILMCIERIRRACHASLALVFHKHRQNGFKWTDLVRNKIITFDQYKMFKKRDGNKGAKIPGSHPEYVWSLVNQQLIYLRKKYKTLYTEQTARQLMCECLKGRTGAGFISAQMGSQLPLTYTHGVTLMGKIYNLIVCVTAAIAFVDLWIKDLKRSDMDKYGGFDNKEMVHSDPIFFAWNITISCFFMLIKTTSISMLLVFCEKISNPFDNDQISFPGLRFSHWIAMDFEILLGFDIESKLQKLGKFIDDEVTEDVMKQVKNNCCYDETDSVFSIRTCCHMSNYSHEEKNL